MSKIRNLRLEHGMSVRTLASRVGVSPATLKNMESRTRIPSLESAYKVANYFDCAIEDLFPKEHYINQVEIHVTPAVNEEASVTL